MSATLQRPVRPSERKKAKGRRVQAPAASFALRAPSARTGSLGSASSSAILKLARERPRDLAGGAASPTGDRKVQALTLSPMKSIIDPNYIYHFKVSTATNLSSNALGVIITVVSADPSFLPEWSSLASLFDSFHVVKMVYRFVPTNKYYTSTKSTRAVLTANDFDSKVALSSYSEGVQYEHSVHDVTTTFEHHLVFPQSRVPDPWVDVATPAESTGAMKFFADGLSNSTEYGLAFIDYFLSFRARQ